MIMGGASAHSGSLEEVLLGTRIVRGSVATTSLEELHPVRRLDACLLLLLLGGDFSHEELAVIDELVYLGQITGKLHPAEAQQLASLLCSQLGSQVLDRGLHQLGCLAVHSVHVRSCFNLIGDVSRLSVSRSLIKLLQHFVPITHDGCLGCHRIQLHFYWCLLMHLKLQLFLSDYILGSLKVGAQRVEIGDGSSATPLILTHRLVECQCVVEIQVFLFQRELGLLSLAQEVSQEVIASTVTQR